MLDSDPNCSLAEALSKQNLFINSTLAQLGCNILWKMFRNEIIKQHGLSLETLNPIKYEYTKLKSIDRHHLLLIFSEYSDGVIPVCFLNIRLRCSGYSNPSVYATCAIVAPVASSFFACWITY